MTQYDIQYRDLAEEIMSFGKEHIQRAVDPKTGLPVKAKKLFHKGFFLDLRDEFPILTTKRMPVSKTHPENGFLFQSELFWIYVMGSNDVQKLRDLGNTVWDEWEIKEGRWKGTIGPAYGHQARHWRKYNVKGQTGIDHPFIIKENIDQVRNLIEGIKNDPMGRRHIINLWNVADLPEMGLMPCALMSIWDVDPDGYLNCHLIQRSGDFFLGVPFNTSQYAMLTHMVAHVTGLKPGFLAHDITNVHIYEGHYAAIEKQLERKPKPVKPTLWINPDVKDFNDFKLTDIRLDDYDAHPGIRAAVTV